MFNYIYYEYSGYIYLKSSSISKTLASKLLEDFSFISSSFILLFIIIVLRDIFFLGLFILSSQGSHCRKTLRTCKDCITAATVRAVLLTNPGWHVVSLRCPVVVVEDNNSEDHTAGHHHHDAVEICTCKNKFSSQAG